PPEGASPTESWASSLPDYRSASRCFVAKEIMAATAWWRRAFCTARRPRFVCFYSELARNCAVTPKRISNAGEKQGMKLRALKVKRPGNLPGRKLPARTQLWTLSWEQVYVGLLLA